MPFVLQFSPTFSPQNKEKNLWHVTGHTRRVFRAFSCVCSRGRLILHSQLPCIGVIWFSWWFPPTFALKVHFITDLGSASSSLKKPSVVLKAEVEKRKLFETFMPLQEETNSLALTPLNTLPSIHASPHPSGSPSLNSFYIHSLSPAIAYEETLMPKDDFRPVNYSHQFRFSTNSLTILFKNNQVWSKPEEIRWRLVDLCK